MNGFHFFLSYCFKYLFYFWKRNSCHQIHSLTKLVCITFFPFSFINIHIKGGTIRTKAATASTTLYSYLDIWYTNSWTSAIDALSCLAGMQYNRVILDYCRLHAWQQENSKTMWRISEREKTVYKNKPAWKIRETVYVTGSIVSLFFFSLSVVVVVVAHFFLLFSFHLFFFNFQNYR